MHVTSQECLVLEDATAGVLAAKAAGCICIAIQSFHTPVQDITKADYILASLEKITPDLIVRGGFQSIR